MLRRLCATFCLCVLTGPLLAHADLPTPQWCEGGTPREVASFRLTPEALAARPGTGTCTGSGDGSAAKNCGQFDDDYRRGYDASQGFCGGFERLRRRGEAADVGSVIVLVTSPETFLRTTHHADYTIAQGLEGVCVRCESLAPPVLPVTPRSSN